MSKLPGSEQPEEGRCGAKLSRSEQKYGHPRYCRRFPMKGKKRCRRCGGASLSGVKHPNFKHGRRSMYAPQRHLQRLEEFLNDERLHSLDEEIAVLKARVAEIIGDLDAHGPTDTWTALQRERGRFEYFQRAGRHDKANEAVIAILHLIDAGASVAASMREVRGTVRDLEKLVTSERRHRLNKEYVIQISEFNFLMAYLFESMTRHIADKSQLNNVIDDWDRLLRTSTSGHTATA